MQDKLILSLAEPARHWLSPTGLSPLPPRAAGPRPDLFVIR